MESQKLTGPQADTSLLERVRALREVVEVHAQADETATELSAEVLRALEDAGVFMIMAPRSFGGSEADPQLVIDVLRELSYYDGSTGWYCQAATTGVAFAAAYLGDRAVEEIFFSGKKVSCAGNAAPTGKAEKVADGYRISGNFSFGTGSPNASWLGGGYILHKDGAPVLDENGQPTMLMAIAPRAKVELLGNWNVLGLRGTGSYDFKVLDQVVHSDFVFELATAEQKRGGPLYGMGFISIPSLCHASFALGCPRRAVDEWAAFAQTKKRIPSGMLRDSESFQRNLASAHGDLRAAEAYVRRSFTALFEASAARAITDDQRLDAKLSTSHALAVGTRVAHTAYTGCTTTALRNGNKVQRCFRDMEAANAHFMTGEQSWIQAGRFLAGIPGATAF